MNPQPRYPLAGKRVMEPIAPAIGAGGGSSLPTYCNNTTIHTYFQTTNHLPMFA